MAHFTCITPPQAQQLLSAGPCQLVDIRDEQSYRLGRIAGAQHLGNHNLAEFVNGADRQVPVVVCCYHGISSQSAASYLADQGFAEVYSLDGGYDLWQRSFPEQCESS